MLGVLPLLVFTVTLLSTGCAQRSAHRFKLLTSQRVRSVDQCNDVTSLFEYDFPSILKPRLPGTESHAEVREYIISRLEQLDCSRWNITQHTFEDNTPDGVRPFTNIIATLDPHVDKRLVLAAHYDSKYIYSSQGRHFLGATDSALPVALLLDMALSLDAKLQERELTDYSLQLIFFDGEEAFKSWTATDSLYGSRQLAQDMNEQGGLLSVGDKTGLQAMDVFILLDLIGATNPYPAFHDTHSDTTNIFQRFVKIEKRLDSANYLEKHPQNYFKEQTAFGRYSIQDDHKPFQQRGVPIVHLITVPFPHVWHTLDDNASAIDKTMVANFKLIMMVFLHEYFHLR